jgi:hypothetical protein
MSRTSHFERRSNQRCVCGRYHRRRRQLLHAVALQRIYLAYVVGIAVGGRGSLRVAPMNAASRLASIVVCRAGDLLIGVW